MRREDGLTLVELLVSLSIGVVVLLGSFTIVDQLIPASNRVADRVAAQGRGRSALEQVLQELRSTVCVQQTASSAWQAPFDATSDDNQATFYTQTFAVPTGTTTTADPGRGGVFVPEKHSLQITGGRLVDTTLARWDTATSTWTVLNPAPQRVVLAKISPKGTTPYFTYYGYNATTGALDDKLTTPLSATDRPRVVRIDMAFTASPDQRSNGGTSSDQDAALQGTAQVPIPADTTTPASSAKGPACTV